MWKMIEYHDVFEQTNAGYKYILEQFVPYLQLHVNLSGLEILVLNKLII